MNRRLLTIVVAFFRVANLCAQELPTASPKEVGLSAEKLDRVASLVQAAIDKRQCAGAVVLVSRHGKVAFVQAFGKQDIESGKVMVAESIFRIYSMTKPITTTAALTLLDEGKFNLDDPVSNYLPEFKGLRVYAGPGERTVEVKREMTIRDLMRHTSGLVYGMPNGSPVDKMYITNNIGEPGKDLASMVTALGRLPLQCQPGTRFNYSYSTDVLGRVIEVISKKRLDEFIRDRVLRPLDMRDTGFVLHDDQLNRFTACYRLGGSGSLTSIDSPGKTRFRSQPKLLSAGGGLLSTARDYARFCQMLLNGGELSGTRILRPETVREMTSNQLPSEALPMQLGGFNVPDLGFGLGLSVKLDNTVSRPDPAAGEYGWSGAASTFFWVAPKSDLFAIVLQQIQPLNLGLQLSLKPAIYSAIEP